MTTQENVKNEIDPNEYEKLSQFYSVWIAMAQIVPSTRQQIMKGEAMAQHLLEIAQDIEHYRNHSMPVQ